MPRPPAQEGVDLGLDRLLHEETDGDATDLLEDGRKVLLRAEQRVDLDRVPRTGVNRLSRSALDARAVCHFMIANDTPSALSSSLTAWSMRAIDSSER